MTYILPARGSLPTENVRRQRLRPVFSFPELATAVNAFSTEVLTYLDRARVTVSFCLLSLRLFYPPVVGFFLRSSPTPFSPFMQSQIHSSLSRHALKTSYSKSPRPVKFTTAEPIVAKWGLFSPIAGFDRGYPCFPLLFLVSSGGPLNQGFLTSAS